MPVPKQADSAQQLDVGIASTTGSLEWLNAWPALKRYHLIIVCESGPAPTAPAGFNNVQITTRTDALQQLKLSSAQLGCWDLIFLLSKKRYVVLLDEDCSPAVIKSQPVDPIAQHITNLTSPSTPFFFNTLYDPFRGGADFVRGYPFSLREGQPTALSHGLSLGHPDYDAAVQMSKPLARNTRYVDAVLTVPRGSLFNLSFRNVAVDRQLLGIALFSGLDADSQPLGKHGDTSWASFCSKVVGDHLGYGIKTGLPYVSCDKPSVTAATANMEMEYKNVKWQKEVVGFFQSVKLSPEANSPAAAYAELTQKVRAELGPLDPHFKQVADAMDAWAAAYKAATA